MSERLHRSDVFELVNALDVENNFAFLPHTRMIAGVSKAITLCNCYSQVWVAAWGLRLPTARANDQLLWLRSAPGIAAGWKTMAQDRALYAAEIGCCVLVGRAGQPHGHLCPVLPALDDDPMIYVSSAGSRNHKRAPITAVFGTGGKPLEWFYHA